MQHKGGIDRSPSCCQRLRRAAELKDYGWKDEWPQLTVACAGTKEKPHRTVHLSRYERAPDGRWIFRFHGVRDGTEYFVPSNGTRAGLGPSRFPAAEAMTISQPCPNRKCKVMFRVAEAKVTEVFDLWLDAGLSEIAVVDIDDGLRRLAERRGHD